MNDATLVWKELLATVVRRRRLILAVTLIGAIASLGMALLKPPVYRAVAKVMVLEKRASVAASPDAATRPFVTRSSESAVNSEVALLKSPELVRTVLDAYPNIGVREPGWTVSDIVSLPFDIPHMIYRRYHGIEAATRRDRIINGIAARISVLPVPRSSLITVSFQSANPKWAATMVNELLDAHMGLNAKRSNSDSTEEFFHRQKDLAAADLAEHNAALARFRERAGTEILTQNEGDLRARIASIEAELATARTGLAEVRATADFLAGQSGQQAFGGVDQATAMIQQRMLDLEIQKTQLLGQYAPTSTVIRDIDRQISQLRHIVNPDGTSTIIPNALPVQDQVALSLVAARTQKAALQARVADLTAQLEKYRGLVGKLDSLSAEREQLEKNVASAKESYTTYVRKLEEVRFSNALDESKILNLAVAEPATVPTTPLRSSAALGIAVGTLFSLLAGLALAYLMDRLDPTVKSANEAARATGIAVIGEIPS